MALFCAPAWMIKGGGGSKIGDSLITEDDFFNNREKVRGDVAGVWHTKSLKLEFTMRVNGEGFTDDPEHVNLYFAVKRQSAIGDEGRMPGLFFTGKTVNSTITTVQSIQFKKTDFSSESVLADVQNPRGFFIAFRTNTQYLVQGQNSPLWRMKVDNG